ncbi:MAG: polysaccharide biosynthesis tyrosine autokinase, partial [Bacteroidales bacterium]|nr:polysaccharide biosynthesis tyrosine autokinase [Bacteroidales bacterium]
MENMNYGSHPQQMGAAPQIPMQDTKSGPFVKFDIKDFLMILLMNWFWIILCALIGFAVAFVFVQTLQPQYQRMSDIQVKTSKAEGLDVKSALGLGESKSSNLTDELYIFKTLKLAREVATQLNMDVAYYSKGTFRKHYLFEDQPFSVNFKNEYLHDLTIGICPISAQTFTIFSLFVNGIEQKLPDDKVVYFFGQDIKLPVTEEDLSVVVTDKNYPYLVESLDREVFVTRSSMDQAALLCQSMITAEGRTSSTIRITCTARSVMEADAVLQAAFEVYNSQSIEERKNLNLSSMDFIEERIEETARELGENANKISSSAIAKKAQQATVEPTVTASMIGERQEAASRVSAVNSTLENAENLRYRIETAIANKDYIPMLPGLAQAGVSGQVTAYNAQIQQRKRMVENSSADNPVVRKIDANLEQQLLLLTSTIDAYIENLKNDQKLASSRLARSAVYSRSSKDNVQKYDSTAIEEQSLVISQEYRQEYFSYLLRRREELRLDMAVISADTKMIEDPMGSLSPISPIPTDYYIKFTVAGFAFPIVLMLLLTLMNTTIRGRRDVEDAISVPFIGEVPEFQEKDDKGKTKKKKKKAYRETGSRIVINNNSKNIISEAFRIVQSNLSYIKCDEKGRKAQTIMFTSFAPGAGKSFVSVNIASCLANDETKRAIWVDLDLRKGHKNNQLLREDLIPSSQIGLSAYLAGNAELEDCIIESAGNDSLDIMVAGPIPPNPVQLFMSDRFEELVKILRERYEYIIFDSVPASVVADASIVNHYMDITIYVVRVGVTDRRILPEIEKLYHQHKFNNMTCLLNGSKITKRYGYGK